MRIGRSNGTAHTIDAGDGCAIAVDPALLDEVGLLPARIRAKRHALVCSLSYALTPDDVPRFNDHARASACTCTQGFLTGCAPCPASSSGAAASPTSSAPAPFVPPPAPAPVARSFAASSPLLADVLAPPSEGPPAVATCAPSLPASEDAPMKAAPATSVTPPPVEATPSLSPPAPRSLAPSPNVQPARGRSNSKDVCPASAVSGGVLSHEDERRLAPVVDALLRVLQDHEHARILTLDLVRHPHAFGRIKFTCAIFVSGCACIV